MDYIQLDETKLRNVVGALNQYLADMHVHYQNLRSAHWNLKGMLFFNLHEVLETQYDTVKVQIDNVAERIRTLQYHPVSKLSDIVDMNRLNELEEKDTAFAMISSLLKNNTHLINDLREVIEKAQDAEDEGTIDLAGSLLNQTEKTCWMLNSWLQDKSAFGKMQPVQASLKSESSAS